MANVFDWVFTIMAIATTMGACILALFALGRFKRPWWANVVLVLLAWGFMAAMILSANHLEKLH